MKEALEYLREQIEREKKSCDFYETRAEQCARGSADYNMYKMAAQFRYGAVAALEGAIFYLQNRASAE